MLRDVAMKLGVPPDALERTPFSDIDEVLILRDFKPLPSAETFLKYYNGSERESTWQHIHILSALHFDPS